LSGAGVFRNHVWSPFPMIGEVCVDGKFPLFLAARNKAEKFEMVVARWS